MTPIELKKRYIIEGQMLVKDAIIQVLEEDEDNHFNNFNMSHEGELVTDAEISNKIKPIMDKLMSQGAFDGDNGIQLQKDVLDFCKGQFARQAEIATYEQVVEYLHTRNQGFSV